MSYTHIFTDGVDKLLSASIWFDWYGGNNAFCFYQDGALKGYIEANEYERLKIEGAKVLTESIFVEELLASSNNLTEEFYGFTNNLGRFPLDNKVLDKAAELLEKCYRNYFYTEEYFTDGLRYEKDSAVIEKVGRFRLEFIQTCIDATELVYKIAKEIHPSLQTEFYTIDELVSGYKLPESREREIAFLLIKKYDSPKLFAGENAVERYEALVEPGTIGDKRNEIVLQGSGASGGVVQGKVYVISLTDLDINEKIEHMPQGAVLVSESTQPHLVLACRKASAIVTNEGGVLSHAAIIARELKVPCVVGTREATEHFSDGDEILVDGGSGKVVLLKKAP